MFHFALALLLLTTTPQISRADQNYSQQVFFENSLSPRSYFYSDGKASSPSILELVENRLPVETANFISGPNSLKLNWKSLPGGGWSVEVKLYQWRDRLLSFPGSHLYLWLYAVDGIKAEDLPRLVLRDADGNFTQPLDWGGRAGDIPPHTWTRVVIPLASFATASLHPFHSNHLSTVVLSRENRTQRHTHCCWTTFGFENEPRASEPAPPSPASLRAVGYERHIDISWQPVQDPSLAQYVIYRSIGGEPFRAIGVQRPGVNRYCDYTETPA